VYVVEYSKRIDLRFRIGIDLRGGSKNFSSVDPVLLDLRGPGARPPAAGSPGVWERRNF